MASFSISKFEAVFSTLPTKFIWQYQDSNGSWITFDRSTTRKLDAAYKTSSSSGAVDIKIKKDQVMSCTFSDMQWEDPANKNSYRSRKRPIKRDPKISAGLQELIHLEDSKELFLKKKRRSVEAMFETFKDEDDTNTLELRNFAEACNIDVANLDLILISYYCHSEKFMTITKEEFVQGMGRMECDSVDAVCAKV